MSIRIAIVDDNAQSAKIIEGYIYRYGKENNETFEVDFFSDGDEIASDYQPVYNIIFLDVQMKRLDGMKAAEIIRGFDKNVIIVFVTNMAQYAIKGYEVDALDFLLKPVPYFAFSQQLKRSIETAKKRTSKFLLVATDNGVIKIDVQDIIFIEVVNRKTILHIRDNQYSLSSTMKDLEEKISDKNFFRCNYCYYINLSYVKEVSGNIATVGEHKLLVSRPRKKAFMEALTRHIGGIIR